MMEMTGSIWLEHPKYPGYRFCPEGGILNVARGKLITGSINRDGYRTWTYRRKGKMVHRAIADVFCEKRIDSNNHKVMQVNHKNGIKDDNRFENLEWVSPAEQQAHSRNVLKNRCAIGELSGSAVLCRRQIFAIRLGLRIGRRGILTKLSRYFGVSLGTIHAIKTRRSWDSI